MPVQQRTQQHEDERREGHPDADRARPAQRNSDAAARADTTRAARAAAGQAARARKLHRAAFLFGDYQTYDGKRKHDGWAGYHAATQAAAAWRALDPDNVADVIPIKTLADFQAWATGLGDKQQSLAVMAVFGHFGQVDGLRLDSSATHPISELPVEVRQQLPPEATGTFDVRQDGVFRVQLTAEPEPVEIHNAAARVVQAGAIEAIMEPDSMLFLAGCYSDGSVDQWASALMIKNVKVIGFHGSVGLEAVASPGVQRFLRTGKLAPTMRQSKTPAPRSPAPAR